MLGASSGKRRPRFTASYAGWPLQPMLGINSCAWVLANELLRSSDFLRKSYQIKNATFGDVLYLVTLPTRNWKTLWDSLERMSQQLEELGIGDDVILREE